MAKRWVIQKRLKMKKFREQSRGVMKRLSAETVNCGRSPNRDVMQWYKNSAKSLSLKVTKAEVSSLNGPRLEALALRARIKDACPEWLYFRLMDDSSLWARMYFQNNPPRCCVVEFVKRNNILRRSIVYRNRDMAYQRWFEGTIDWVGPDKLYHPHIPVTHKEATLPCYPETS